MLIFSWLPMLAGQEQRPPGQQSSSEAAAKAADTTSPTDNQNGVMQSASTSDAKQNRLADLPKNFLLDQKMLWTSPSRIRMHDLPWLVPFAGVTSGLIASDGTIEKALPKSTSLINRSTKMSNYGAASLAAVDGGMYLLGLGQHNEHLRETGILGGEAAVNSLLIGSALQQVAQRQRPFQGNGSGAFWEGGTSFPSNHSIAAWSLASVIAHEYPGPLTQIFAYGAASAISITRLTGRRHFSSDIVVGSTLGWLIGRQIYKAHHDHELEGADWGTFNSFDEDDSISSANRGSPYVPLDSWIYPALERLAALGYIQTEFMGLRPWTRSECERLVAEAEDLIVDKDDSEATNLYQALQTEFSLESDTNNTENRAAQVESIYTRIEGIAGKPLSDSYHFGQTIINDFGRPYARGINAITGASGWSTYGPLVLYLRGEYQHAPASSASAYSQNVRDAIAAVDQNPVQPPNFVSARNQFRLLDSYVGFNIHDVQISFGKQSLWWGPGEGSALLLSDNAEPIYMARISQTSPTKLPSFLGWLGPLRTELFFGKLSGERFPGNAYIHGEKISFKPTPNLEIGLTRTAQLGGVGRSLTAAAIFHSYVSIRESGFFGPHNNPGKRTGGLNITYRVPFARDWLSVYLDSLSSDDPSPLAAPRRAALSPGVYVSRIPKLPKLDFRAEAVNTNTPSSGFGTKPNQLPSSGRFVYYDFYYHDLYTNKGNIIGSWIGREGTAVQLWSTYWHSAQSTVRFGYRHSDVSRDFLRGGTTDDFSVQPVLRLQKSLELSSLLQYEKWSYHLLSPTTQSNFTTAVQLTLFPAAKLSLHRQEPPAQAQP